MTEDSVGREQTDDGSGWSRLSRRRLLASGAAGVAGLAAAGAIAGEAGGVSAPAQPSSLLFLTRWEFDYVMSMAETIWPTDELGPGARVAGVGFYVDGQLSGSWGQGHRFYLNGPFFSPADTGHGWQIPMTPGEVYRAFLPGYDQYVRSAFGAPYPNLPPDVQAKAMDDLRTGKAVIPLGGSTAFGSSDFFAMFRQNVLEGMLADPAYGGNQGMVGWKWIGYPGDPMRRGDVYNQYIFNNRAYPFEAKPLPMTAPPIGPAKPGSYTPPAGKQGGHSGMNMKAK